MTLTQEITLDIFEAPLFEYINAKQEDNVSRVLAATITANGETLKPDHTKAQAFFRATKPDKTGVMDPATIGEDGKITFALTDQVLAVPGDVAAEIAIVEGDQVLTTATFYIQVEKRHGGTGAASENEFLVLTEATKKAEEAARSAELAAENANAAAEKVTQAANGVQQAVEAAGAAAGTANEAAERADTAAENAGRAAGYISGVTVTAHRVETGGEPTAEAGDRDGHLHIDLGLAAGDTGPAGQDGADGFSPTVDVAKEGKTATVTITDAAGPHVFTVLDGEDGAGQVTSVNGQTGAVEIGSLPNPQALTFTGGASVTYDGSQAQSVSIPTALKNPKLLTFTGGSTITYDGSTARSVAIPTLASLGAASKWTQLWKNSKPAAAFNSQTITISGLSSYTLFAVTVAYSNSFTEIQNTNFVYIPSKTTMYLNTFVPNVQMGQANIFWGGRQVVFNTSNNTVLFQGGADGYGNVNANGWGIPIYIHGTKI